MTISKPIKELYDIFKAMNATIVFSKKCNKDPRLVIKRPQVPILHDLDEEVGNARLYNKYLTTKRLNKSKDGKL